LVLLFGRFGKRIGYFTLPTRWENHFCSTNSLFQRYHSALCISDCAGMSLWTTADLRNGDVRGGRLDRSTLLANPVDAK
jgi:hypothetical protein